MNIKVAFVAAAGVLALAWLAFNRRGSVLLGDPTDKAVELVGNRNNCTCKKFTNHADGTQTMELVDLTKCDESRGGTFRADDHARCLLAGDPFEAALAGEAA